MIQKYIHCLPVTGSILAPRGVGRALSMSLEGVLPVTGFFCPVNVMAREPRKHIIHENYAELHLGGTNYTKVDLDDFHRFKDFRWQCVGSVEGKRCAMRTTVSRGVPKRIRLYREIMECPDGYVVDHVNHDTLDNRKSNLRIVTQTQNLYNAKKTTSRKSQYKGVNQRKRDGRFFASLLVNGKAITRTCENEILAAKKYDELALKYRGEFALLNFPSEVK